MSLRHHPANQHSTRPGPRRRRDSAPERRTTTLDPRTPWTSLVVWFLASFALGAELTLGYTNFKDGQPTATSITIGDGSWAEVSLADDYGMHQVAEGGPRSVWRILENTHTLWTDLGQPGWNRFGLTVAEDHQHVWLDTPNSDHTWPLTLIPTALWPPAHD
ncbi:MAG: hypothetical protein ACRDTG_15495 [Pseudonocardiaceae bacterium]